MNWNLTLVRNYVKRNASAVRPRGIGRERKISWFNLNCYFRREAVKPQKVPPGYTHE
jgi:hypothetical protein